MVARHLALEFNRIKCLRESLGWTQDQVFTLAESLGISRDFEQWGWEELDKLIEALGTIPDPRIPAHYKGLEMRHVSLARKAFGLSQQEVLALAQQIGLPPNPQEWALSNATGHPGTWHQVKLVQAMERKHSG